MLTVIIPTLNEAQALPPLLAQLQAQQGLSMQLLVADGGSVDGTVGLARAHGAEVLATGKGRGTQMNAAAAQARHPWLLFLHADSQLTHPQQLAQALALLQAQPHPLVAGHWPLHFIGGSRSRLYPYMQAKTASNRPGSINGDQGLFISAAGFKALGGYNTQLPFLEDQRLATRISQTGEWLLLPGVLNTSARRFESEGHYQRYWLMAIIMGLDATPAAPLLAQLPGLYRAQSHTQALDLQPFAAAVGQFLQALPANTYRQVRIALGRYLADNAWQLPLIAEQLFPRLAGRLLPLHDRWLLPRLGHPLTQGLAQALAAALLQAFCWQARHTAHRV